MAACILRECVTMMKRGSVAGRGRWLLGLSASLVVAVAWSADPAPGMPRPTHDPKQVAAARDPAAPAPTAAELLPNPPRMKRDDCVRLNAESEPYYEALYQRGLTGMRNPSARVAYAPPAWTSLMEDPLFVQWLDRHVDETCYRAVRIRTWLGAIGSIHDIEDRKAAGDTRLVLGEARAAGRAK
jgi:hypothetical protein